MAAAVRMKRQSSTNLPKSHAAKQWKEYEQFGSVLVGSGVLPFSSLRDAMTTQKEQVITTIDTPLGGAGQASAPAPLRVMPTKVPMPERAMAGDKLVLQTPLGQFAFLLPQRLLGAKYLDVLVFIDPPTDADMKHTIPDDSYLAECKDLSFTAVFIERQGRLLPNVTPPLPLTNAKKGRSVFLTKVCAGVRAIAVSGCASSASAVGVAEGMGWLIATPFDAPPGQSSRPASARKYEKRDAIGG
eukprot:2024333-Prymnesium_polylepis.1